jgi:ketosteroid isomerase-like protein
MVSGLAVARACAYPDSHMKNIFVGLAICLTVSLSVLAASAVGQIGQSNSEEAKILKLDRQWYEAGIERDAAALDQLLAPEFLMTTSYGRVVTRDQLLQKYRSPEQSFKLKTFKTDEVKVRIFGDAAIVTGSASLDIEASDLRFGSATRFTRVYVRADGSWKLAAHQATRIIR